MAPNSEYFDHLSTVVWNTQAAGGDTFDDSSRIAEMTVPVHCPPQPVDIHAEAKLVL
jgi:hypothetical protein